jgi:hypothetical protein
MLAGALVTAGVMILGKNHPIMPAVVLAVGAVAVIIAAARSSKRR